MDEFSNLTCEKNGRNAYLSLHLTKFPFPEKKKKNMPHNYYTVFTLNIGILGWFNLGSVTSLNLDAQSCVRKSAAVLAKSTNPDQPGPIGPVWSGASIYAQAELSQYF